MSEHYKDIGEGDRIRYQGKIYQIQNISWSPLKVERNIDSLVLDLVYMADDFEEALADLAKLEGKK